MKDSNLNLTKEEFKTILREIGVKGIAKFDFKKKKILLFDGGLVSIDEVERNNRVTNKMIKQPASSIWFASLDETIKNLEEMRDFLQRAGYTTNNE